MLDLMRRRWITVLIALAVGVFVTAASYFASNSGAQTVSEVLFWPNFALQALLPAPNIGTPDHPIYEGTPLNILAFFASFPFATLVYAGLAYLVLRRRKV
jgi:hypothetical protein